MNGKPVEVEVAARDMHSTVRIVRDDATPRADAIAELAAAAEVAAMAAPLPPPAVRERLRILLVTAAAMSATCKPRAERKAG